MARKRKIHIGRPDKWETISIVLYGTFLYLFNDMVNIISSDPLGIEAVGTPWSGFKVPLVGILWFSFGLFHIFLMVVVGRSMWAKGKNTHHYYDLIAGTIILLGTFAMLIPTVVMLMGKSPDYIIPWFFNIGRITLYHIGIGIQVLGMLWFAGTK